jgi:capsular exopolysaccharide synthesis family protein
MSEAQGGEERARLGAYLNAFWKHKWLVLGFGALVMTGTVIFTQRQPRIYEATTSVVINPNAPQYLPAGAGNDISPLGIGNDWHTSEYFETQYRILRSRHVAKLVADRLGLDRDLEFLGVNDVDDPDEKAKALASADPVGTLVQHIAVEPVEESHVVLVKVRDRSPERAARIADAVAEAYADSNVDNKVTQATDAVTWLNEQATTLHKEVVDAEDQLLAFKRENAILSASLGDKQNLVSANLQDAQQKLRQARDETARLKAMRDQLARATDADAADVAVDEVLDNGLIQRLKEREVQLENERTDLLKRYLEGHPDVQTANEKIKRVKQAIVDEVNSVKAAIEAKYQVALEAERNLEADVGQIEGQAQQLTAKELTYRRLEEIVNSKKELLSTILVRLKEAELQAQARANNVSILDRAQVPTAAVSPRLLVNLAVAAVLALLGGLGLALLVEGLDSSVKSQEQVEQLGLTFLGIVPSIRAARGAQKHRFEGTGNINPDRYVIEHPNSTAAECVRTIRTNLLFMAPERELKTLLIASAGPREGKTATSVNIGATMAMSGSRVLLIDSDLRRPRLHRIFDMQNDRGLTNLIVDQQAELSSVVRPSGIEGLDLLTTGPIPPNPAELLHTQAFKRVVARLQAAYDRIVFDSPPLLAVTDAQILGQLCDGAVLVVRANETSIDMVRKASRLLKDVNVNILGTLLNNVDVSRRGYGQYYYRYYRRDGGYYPEGEDTQAVES